jgi:hypothetical protein
MDPISIIPKLRKHLPDYWYEKQRKAIAHYIRTRGQEVKHIARVDTKVNMYHDVVYAKTSIKNITAIILHDPSLITFLGRPFSQYEEEEVELFAYFSMEDKVVQDDLIVVEYKTADEQLDRDVYLVSIGKSFLFEQELVRKYKLTNLRNVKLVEVYSSEALDEIEEYVEGSPPGTDGFIQRDVHVTPGGFSSTYENRIDPPIVHEAVFDKKTGKLLGHKGVDIVMPDVPSEVPFHHGYRDGDHPVAPEDKSPTVLDPPKGASFLPVEKIDQQSLNWTKEDPFEKFEK